MEESTRRLGSSSIASTSTVSIPAQSSSSASNTKTYRDTQTSFSNYEEEGPSFRNDAPSGAENEEEAYLMEKAPGDVEQGEVYTLSSPQTSGRNADTQASERYQSEDDGRLWGRIKKYIGISDGGGFFNSEGGRLGKALIAGWLFTTILFIVATAIWRGDLFRGVSVIDSSINSIGTAS